MCGCGNVIIEPLPMFHLGVAVCDDCGPMLNPDKYGTPKPYVYDDDEYLI